MTKEHFTIYELINPWDAPIVDTNFYKWLGDNSKFFEIRYTLYKEYLVSLGMNFETDRITDRDLESMGYILEQYEIDLRKGTKGLTSSGISVLN